jgi:SAM-dependent methyltransferase
MNLSNSPLSYWEEKILQWERLRYSKWLFFYPLSWTIRSRLNSAIKIIKVRTQKNWSVLELGCGSGILAASICEDIKDYLGIDIASNAIALAKEKLQKPHVKFLAMDVLKASYEKKNLVIFLGLTDWLEMDQLRDLFSKLHSDNIFFSYTEVKAVSIWNPYHYYRIVMDRKSLRYSYKARSYSGSEIKNLLNVFGYSFEIVKPASLLNPGVLVWAKK